MAESYDIRDVSFHLLIRCRECGESTMVSEKDLEEGSANFRPPYFCVDCRAKLQEKVDAIVVFEETRIVLTHKYGQVAPLVLERDESRNGPSEGESP